ncbi:hypothetical protein CEXT_725791 [Caerostris extrusa]|uniref:Uncharacterized protein n=1 Tax=Caerostris extrusa TaxID=172846 RepID=A0AAV4XSS7_CAEEX|nr:hypothetical protein CEXT_725791 [Caerostris extrusa]
MYETILSSNSNTCPSSSRLLKVGGQAFIHHWEGDILFKRRRPPTISAGDTPDISTTDGALSRGTEQSSEKVWCDFRRLLRKLIEMGSRVRVTNDGSTPVTLRFW